MCEEGWWGHISMGNLTRAERRSNRSGVRPFSRFEKGPAAALPTANKYFPKKVL
jgi:hypothetical protein